MSTDSRGLLPGPHADRSGGGPPSPARLDEQGPDESARAFYEEEIVLPGFGAAPDRCRPRKPVGFCAESGHVTLASASPCATRRCPDHWAMWQREAAVNIVARLAAYRHAQSGREKRLLHVVDSPDPQRRWTADAFYDERTASYEAVSGVGGRGGVCVPHAYRTSDDGDWLFEQAVEKGDWEADWGKWSLLRRAADDWGEMQRFVEAGPHYHHLVPAADFDPDEIPDRRTVKNIRSLDRFEIRDMTGYRDMARTAMYLLSHAAHRPRKRTESGHAPHTVTYWGDVHPNGFNPEEELTATEWNRIQEMAERAVTTRPGDAVLKEQEVDPDPLTCPHDGCESEVVPVDQLRAYLNDDEWFHSLPREQRRVLVGVDRWLDNLGDRPPPTSNPARLREWLADLGREVESVEQSRLSTVA